MPSSSLCARCWLSTLAVIAASAQVYKSAPQSPSYSDYYNPNIPVHRGGKYADKYGHAYNRPMAPSSATTYDSMSLNQKHQCYSCISEEAQVYWKVLDARYSTPASFTPDCDSRERPALMRLGTVPCVGICLTMKWKVQMAGECIHHSFTTRPQACPSAM